jgi:signal transduction histidine kinase
LSDLVFLGFSTGFLVELPFSLFAMGTKIISFGKVYLIVLANFAKALQSSMVKTGFGKLQSLYLVCIWKLMKSSTHQNYLLKKAWLLALLFVTAASLKSFGQNPDTTITINKDLESITIQKFAAGFLPTSFNIEANYKSDILSYKPFTSKLIPPADVSKKTITRFTVINNTDKPDSIYFFPTFYFRHVVLYKIENDKATPLPVIAPAIKDSVSYRLFHVMPHDTMTILAECYPVRTYTDAFKVRLINPTYIEAFAIEIQQVKKHVTVFTYVFCGLLLMMVLFSFANFFQGGSKEFLYYAAYAIFMGLMLFTKQFYFSRSSEQNFFFESYMDFILQGLGIWFFMIFMIKFLDTKRNFPFLHKLYITAIIFVPLVLVLYTYIHYSDIDYYWENLLENVITKNALLAMMVIFLVYAIKNRHHKLLRYLFWGNFLYLIFSLGSLLIVLDRDIFNLPPLLNDSLVLYELGLLIELIFFLMGLTYKNRTQLIEQTTERERLKMENERKELEKQVAVMQAHQEERERISADIHDELGSGMTTIRLMSEIAKNKMKGNVPVEIEKISNSANEVLNKMNAIIWSMNSSNDTLDSLISYIRVYAIEYFEGTEIDCKVTMPQEIPFKELNGDKRRNIFLCVKETLNNTLKHSKASKVNINIETNHSLHITIADNGQGIDQEKIRKFGNGLKNIERRMKSIGGNYTISNNNGTQTKLESPL